MDMLTVRAAGDVDLHHGDDVFLTPDMDRLHRFDQDGLAVR
jgi:multiple sugar transport system ATP-binding protein